VEGKKLLSCWRLWLSSVLLLTACASAFADQAPTASTLSARLSGSDQRISISSTKIVNSSGVNGLVVQSTAHGVTKVLFLPSAIEQPTATTIVTPTRAAVVGNIGWDAQALTVFDPTDARVLGQALCRSAALSPNGKTIAFVRMFPSHFVPIDLQTAKYAVLDLSGDLGEAITSSRSDVGEVVYPPLPPAPGAKFDSDIHTIDGKIRWLSSTSFTFTDRFHGVASDVVVTKQGTRWMAAVVSTRKAY